MHAFILFSKFSIRSSNKSCGKAFQASFKAFPRASQIFSSPAMSFSSGSISNTGSLSIFQTCSIGLRPGEYGGPSQTDMPISKNQSGTFSSGMTRGVVLHKCKTWGPTRRQLIFKKPQDRSSQWSRASLPQNPYLTHTIVTDRCPQNSPKPSLRCPCSSYRCQSSPCSISGVVCETPKPPSHLHHALLNTHSTICI
jgi:hypothetical protein